MKERDLITQKTQERIDASFEHFSIDENVKVVVNSCDVDYIELARELNRLIELTKKGKKFENFHSLFIYGPTGVGKSEICKQIAEANGCIYHKLEIQKIPLEEFEGFPYLEDRDGRKVVRLAQPTVLPPSDDDNVWLLHLDEFNKADSDKMAAVMNLVLTGEIGGTADFNNETGKSEKYKLPKRTVIVGSGNFKMQENTENLNIVNQMDIATSERFHRAVNLDYNARSWLDNYATKHYSFRFNGDSFSTSTRVPSIILNFIMDKMLEEGNKAPFLIPISFKPDEGGSERTSSPRAWTLVADNIILDAVAEFITLPKGNEYEKHGENSFDVFLQNPMNQIRFLSNQAAEFGLGGEGIVNDIIARFIYFAENRLLPQDIVYRYGKEPKIREKAKNLKKKVGANLRLLLSVADYINDKEVLEPDNVALYISTYIEDVDMPAEDLTAFIYVLKNSKIKTAKSIHERLISISRRYKLSWGDFYYTNEKDIQKSVDVSKKKIEVGK